MNRQAMGVKVKRLASAIALAVMVLAVAFGAGVALADGLKWHGSVESIPAGGKVGSWQVGGRTFVADSNTDFDKDDGPLSLGDCVEVEYTDTGAALLALEIEKSDSCTGSGTEQKVYGLLTAMPAGGRQGDWGIDNVAYLANAGTEFEEEYGAFALGVCVEAEFVPQNGKNVLDELETERAYKCSGGSTSEGELYGIVEEIAPGGMGDWRIGGWLFKVDGDTEIESKYGPIQVGMLVKVEFHTDAAGIHYAEEIEAKAKNDDKGDWDDEEGHAFGVIDALPSGLVGEWTISGIKYDVTAATELDEDDGPFAIGARVKVEYRVRPDGSRLAKEIETTDDNGDCRDDSHAKVVGYVDAMPNGSFYGNWLIGGETYVAAPGAEFDEDHGVFAVGAYVEVEYKILDNGDKGIVEIETEVPPGAGDDDEVGKIDAFGNGSLSAGAVTATGIQVNGKSIALTPATKIDDAEGEIAVGATVLVNSYVGAAEMRTATLVRSLVLDEAVYLPVTVR